LSLETDHPSFQLEIALVYALKIIGETFYPPCSANKAEYIEHMKVEGIHPCPE
jgi:hypothetical protein